MSSDTINPSKKRFVVSIHEVREIVFADEFSGPYSKNVTLSDGSTRTIELTPTIRAGQPVMELKDTGHLSNMAITRVASATQINDNLMVQIFELNDVDSEQHSQQPGSPIPPPNTSLTSLKEFTPPGFRQGIEILNDNTTPMNFVVAVLSTHGGLSREESTQTMLAIHTRGGALIPTPSLDDAQRIAAQIAAEAAKHGYPLSCRPVSIDP